MNHSALMLRAGKDDLNKLNRSLQKTAARPCQASRRADSVSQGRQEGLGALGEQKQEATKANFIYLKILLKDSLK